MQIKKLIIWQKNGLVRNFPFEENKVNVITGDSGKGKTAIIHIIDYCLLSSDSLYISKKNIDEDVNWYGIVFTINNKIITIARQSVHISKDILYYSEIGEVPDIPTKKISEESLKIILEKEFGLNSNMKIPYGGNFIQAGSKITYRYFLLNCYQDQNTLTSIDNLYMKYSDTRTREKIDRTFGMAIGIENEESSIIKERLFNLELERDKLVRKEKKIRNKKSKFNEEIYDLYQEALNLNLVTNTKIISAESKFKILKGLNTQVEKIKHNNKDFEKLDKEIFKKQQELKKLDNFDNGYKIYIEALEDTLDNLEPINYLISNGDKKLIKSNYLNLLLNSLEEGLEEVQKTILEKKSAKLILETKEDKKNIEKEIKELQKQREKLDTIDIKSYQDLYLYIGKLNAILEFYIDFEDIENLENEIEKINKKIFELRGKLEDNELERKFRIELLNDKINLYLKTLIIKGYETDTAVFNEGNKTINMHRSDKSGIEKMQSIGSNSNYLNLHLAYFLSLHELARENNISWMPSFLILDQVNSPYYNTNTKKISKDKEEFDKTLKVLNDYVEKMKIYGFQIILLEHIEENYWKELGLTNFNLVGKEFRGDEALILKNL